MHKAKTVVSLLKRAQQNYVVAAIIATSPGNLSAWDQSGLSSCRPLLPLLEAQSHKFAKYPTITVAGSKLISRTYSSSNDLSKGLSKAASFEKISLTKTLIIDPNPVETNKAFGWIKELLNILGGVGIGSSGSLLTNKSDIFSELDKGHIENANKLQDAIEVNVAKIDEMIATLPLDEIQPLLQLYPSKLDENSIDLLKKVIKKIDEQLLFNERYFKKIMQEERAIKPKGVPKREVLIEVADILNNLKTNITLQNQQLKAIRGFCETFLLRMEKRFSQALIAADAWVREATLYKDIFEDTQKRSILAAETLLANAYNHRAKIHRSLAGVDLENLDMQELRLSRKDYEAGLKIKYDKNILSSLAFLLNDMSGMLPLEEQKTMLMLALDYHKKAKEMDKHDPNIQHGVAYDLYKLQRWQCEAQKPIDMSELEDALAAYSITESKNPNARLFHDRGLTYLLMGNEEAAFADFTKGIKLDNNHPLLCYEYGRLLLKRGEVTLALEALKRGRTVSVDNLSLKKKYDKAIQEVLAVQKHSPLANEVSSQLSPESESPLIFNDIAKVTVISKEELEELDIIKIAKQKEFENALQKCGAYAKQTVTITQPFKIFISYAWGNTKHERWVEQFSKELELAGFIVYLDRWYDRKGKELMDFVSKISEPDVRVIAVGTPSYLEKFNRRSVDADHREPVVGIEARLISYIVGYSRENSERIIPVILEGTPEVSLPFVLRPKLFADFSVNDKFTEMFALVRDIYRIPNRDERFEEIKQNFYRIAQAIEKQTPPDVVKKYKIEQQEALAKWQRDIDEKARTRVEEALQSSRLSR